MASITQKQYRYFLYSQEQHKMCDSVEKSIGREYIPGQVMYNGKWRSFTEISSTPSNNKYADAKLIVEGYLDDINYKLPSRRWRTK